MTSAPAISVVIPTRGRPATLLRCLACLGRQTLTREVFEVVVVTDGPDPETERLFQPGEAGVAESGMPQVRLIVAPRLGNAHAKNVGIEAARGSVVLFLNDDVLPTPGLLAEHVAAHGEWSRGRRATMVVGASLFVTPSEPTLFDVLLNESGLVFFYHRMMDSEGRSTKSPEHDWGYRHAWTLNLSLPRQALVNVGGFRPAIANCCYEDVELAYRCAKQMEMPVLFRPGAVAPHDHRLTPTDYLNRERRLGYSAWGFTEAAPECAAELFGRDIAAPDHLDYARSFIENESRSESAQRAVFEKLAQTLASVLPRETDARSAMIELVVGQQIMLKRLAFRRGLLDAAAGMHMPGLFHPQDGLAAEPGLNAALASA